MTKSSQSCSSERREIGCPHTPLTCPPQCISSEVELGQLPWSRTLQAASLPHFGAPQGSPPCAHGWDTTHPTHACIHTGQCLPTWEWAQPWESAPQETGNLPGQGPMALPQALHRCFLISPSAAFHPDPAPQPQRKLHNPLGALSRAED